MCVCVRVSYVCASVCLPLYKCVCLCVCMVEPSSAATPLRQSVKMCTSACVLSLGRKTGKNMNKKGKISRPLRRQRGMRIYMGDISSSFIIHCTFMPHCAHTSIFFFASSSLATLIPRTDASAIHASPSDAKISQT